ncbi:hypothetical protein ABZP36_009826 [Zizania latifolia]
MASSSPSESPLHPVHRTPTVARRVRARLPAVARRVRARPPAVTRSARAAARPPAVRRTHARQAARHPSLAASALGRPPSPAASAPGRPPSPAAHFRVQTSSFVCDIFSRRGYAEAATGRPWRRGLRCRSHGWRFRSLSRGSAASTPAASL